MFGDDRIGIIRQGFQRFTRLCGSPIAQRNRHIAQQAASPRAEDRCTRKTPPEFILSQPGQIDQFWRGVIEIDRIKRSFLCRPRKARRPGTYVLTNVAAKNAIADQGAQFDRDRSAQFDREIRDAPARIERVGRSERIRRAGDQTARTSAAINTLTPRCAPPLSLRGRGVGGEA